MYDQMIRLQRLVSFRNKASLALALALNAIFDRDLSCETWSGSDPTLTSERVSASLSDSGAPVIS